VCKHHISLASFFVQAKKKQEGTNQFIKIVCAGPVMLFALAQFGKVAVRYSD